MQRQFDREVLFMLVHLIRSCTLRNADVLFEVTRSDLHYTNLCT